jgi:hypothetical protein
MDSLDLPFVGDDSSPQLNGPVIGGTVIARLTHCLAASA